MCYLQQVIRNLHEFLINFIIFAQKIIMVDIGTIIREHLRKSGSSVFQLSKQIKISHSVLYHSLNTNKISITRLHHISQALNHNFFIHFIENTGGTEEQLLKLSTENRELSTKVASLQKEVTYLQEINSLLKSKLTT